MPQGSSKGLHCIVCAVIKKQRVIVWSKGCVDMCCSKLLSSLATLSICMAVRNATSSNCSCSLSYTFNKHHRSQHLPKRHPSPSNPPPLGHLRYLQIRTLGQDIPNRVKASKPQGIRTLGLIGSKLASLRGSGHWVRIVPSPVRPLQRQSPPPPPRPLVRHSSPLTCETAPFCASCSAVGRGRGRRWGRWGGAESPDCSA